MIRDLTTGKTKFVQLIVYSSDGRSIATMKGGVDKNNALHKAKTYQDSVCDILDSRESMQDE